MMVPCLLEDRSTVKPEANIKPVYRHNTADLIVSLHTIRHFEYKAKINSFITIVYFGI